MKNSKITLYLYLQVGKGSKNDVSYVGCIGDDVNGFFNASNLAAMEGHLDILNILIDSGANIEWQHTLVIMSIDRFSHRGFRYKISIKSSNFIFLTKFKLVLSIMVVKLVWM
ncbi:MAG: ankyrin repeat domain-containing protein [Alphaproteobacteria bacterium]|nr:ankyrin repeat domain-containing protein [Alphaproteobacteria bacterium]